MFDNAERIWELVIAIILAAAGGFARMLHKKDQVQLKWTKILSEMFISAFSGIMVLLLARSFGLAGDWLGLVCGMAGWIGPRILDLVSKPALEKLFSADELKEFVEEKNKESESK